MQTCKVTTEQLLLISLHLYKVWSIDQFLRDIERAKIVVCCEANID